jgi:hypothetical protein
MRLHFLRGIHRSIAGSNDALRPHPSSVYRFRLRRLRESQSSVSAGAASGCEAIDADLEKQSLRHEPKRPQDERRRFRRLDESARYSRCERSAAIEGASEANTLVSDEAETKVETLMVWSEGDVARCAKERHPPSYTFARCASLIRYAV